MARTHFVPSSLRPFVPPSFPAFTLIEMLTVVALLVIVLGLMVSLARFVRNRSATQLTRLILTDLNEASARYERAFGVATPPVDILTEPGELPEEQILLQSAEENNRHFVAAMKASLIGKFWWELPSTVYDHTMLRDAWGSPIVLMPYKHNKIGMAPGDKSFYFSAGPDRQYHTRDDNLYSYEMTGR